MNYVAPIVVLKRVEIPEALMMLRSDGIVHVHYKKNTTLDIELQASMRDLFLELTGGKKSPFIFSADEGFSLTKEARENADSFKKNPVISSYAVIADNLGYRMIANFYLKINKPVTPYKIFQNTEEAVQWLHKQ